MEQIALHPNKNLLDPNFTGYKLSLDSVPIHQVSLEIGVEHVLPNDDQYSFLHMRLFGLHNHLQQDPWNNQYVYFINKQKEIMCCTYNNLTGHLSGVSKIFHINSESQIGNYVNTSLCFPSKDLVLILDGCKALYLISTGPRETNDQSWNVLLEESVSEDTGFIILDCKYKLTNEEKSITCLLLSIVDANSMDLKTVTSKEDASKFVSFLNVLTYVEDSNQKWSMKSKKQLYCSGEIEYANLENDANHLCIISKEPLVFFHDSESPIVTENGTENDKKTIDYFWQQNSGDLTIWFNVPADTLRDQISVNVQAREIDIKFDNKRLLEGALYNNVVENLISWTLDENKLEVNLTKHEPGLMWPSLIKDCTKGEEILDPELVKEIHERLAHLCSATEVKAKDIGDMCSPAFNMEQLEECDAINCDSRYLSRLNLASHTVSHQTYLAGVPWLFNCSISPDELQGFCLRHDVDGCIWVPKSKPNSDWRCEHVATFLALGYVQASKQQKKFISCPPDFSYVAICESNRHVFLYRQACSVSGELRNRKQGSKIGTIAKQQLINLPTSDEIFGIHSTNQFLFLLTQSHLFCLDIGGS